MGALRSLEMAAARKGRRRSPLEGTLGKEDGELPVVTRRAKDDGWSPSLGSMTKAEWLGTSWFEGEVPNEGFPSGFWREWVSEHGSAKS